MRAFTTSLVLLTAAAATAGVAAPAGAATSGQVIVSNSTGLYPGNTQTIKVKCPSTYPYAIDASVSGTNGPLFGPIMRADYPGVSSVTMTNPHDPNTNIVVTGRLAVVCSTWLPQPVG